MNLHFTEGEKFCLDGEEYEIVDIDREDEKYPYECYPVEIIEKTKNILAKGVLIDKDEELYEFKDEDGEVYEFVRDENLSVAIYGFFEDKRWCCSDYEILNYKYLQVQKELDALKEKAVDEKKVAGAVDFELLCEIEQDEEGYVADNIDDFFNYMFRESEEWTFKELVTLLTPAMKEKLIFKGNFIGNIGKVGGKYYYHPDVEMLMEKPSVSELIAGARERSAKFDVKDDIQQENIKE